MRVKLNWLNELVDLSDLSTNEIVNKLSLYSTEIESVERVLSGSNLVIGHVLTCVNHPDSDHLHITTVDVGTEVLQIVCGAPNIKEGLYVIVAKVGAELPGDFKIKKSKIRGVESYGMICSLEELGMEKKYVPAEYSDGIYYFKKDVVPGSDPLKELDLDDDVLELGLTPNRSDMLSMLGVGYEVSACFDRPLKLPIVELEEANDKNDLNVRIDTDKCLTYHAKLIKNIKIRKSPDWLISRLIAFGIRPINNAVDITNYILALYGQPLHAFDAQKLGKTIVIRNAKTNEEIVTLDGNKRVLEQEDIVITDGTKPVAIAGVMGGLDTEVENTTKDIVLEVAVFDPISIRKTYKRLDLRSEAAIRYEKGIDRNRVQQALKHACKLFKDLCDAEITSGDVYQGSDEEKEVKIELTSQYISNYLGITITNEEILSICKRLQFETTKTNDVIIVTVPSRRKDVSIKADMVEEIGRIHGYEKLPTTLPYSSLAGKLTNYQTRRKQLKHKLCSLGLTESINYSLRENNNSFTYLFDEGKDVELIYPISNERKVLRRSLLPSLLENVSYVFNRKIKNAAFYEIGKVYYQNETGYIEEEHLAIALSGVLSSTQWKGSVEEADFFTLKGIINSAMQSLGITLDYEKLETIPEMHPLRTAKLISDGKEIGFIGMLHPKYAQEHDLKNVYCLELKLKDILNYCEPIKLYTPVSKVPQVERDLAIVVKKDVASGDIIKTIKSVDKKIISDVKVFDVYVGDKIKDDEKSIALKVIFTANETLTDEVINSKVNKILKAIERNHNGFLRA